MELVVPMVMLTARLQFQYAVSVNLSRRLWRNKLSTLPFALNSVFEGPSSPIHSASTTILRVFSSFFNLKCFIFICCFFFSLHFLGVLETDSKCSCITCCSGRSSPLNRLWCNVFLSGQTQTDENGYFNPKCGKFYTNTSLEVCYCIYVLKKNTLMCNIFLLDTSRVL